MSTAAASRSSPALFTTRGSDNDTNGAVRRAFAKVRSWRPPNNWSGRDWLDEAQAITVAAGWLAGLDYDAARGIPLGAFIYRQAIASTWTRYRQEWAYCLHTAPETLEKIEKVPPRRETGAIDPNLHRKLSKAFDQLSLPEQWLIRQIFWHGATQGGLALVLRISQQAVSRRKARALKHLRRLLHGEPRSHFVARLLAVCAFLNQALDSFPVLDCGL